MKAGKRNSILALAALLLFCTALGLKRRFFDGRLCNSVCGMEDNIVKVKKELRPLESFDGGGYPDSVLSYLDYYGLGFSGDGIEHIFGTFESNGEVLAGHIFKPAKYKSAVIVLHGYLNHCGQLKHLIRHLIEQGYAVAAYDMAGHGLSSGRRGAIEDFSRYSGALSDFVKIVRTELKGPYHIIGFSAGGSAALDYLLKKNDDVFDKVILAAPLVHCVAWKQSRVGYGLFKSFAKSVPRAFRNESSDAEYIEFVRTKDPLQVTDVPFKWLEALYKWNKELADLPPRSRKIKIIQGRGDSTVAWKFNVKFIQDKFGDVQVTLIEQCGHELFNESPDIRKVVFSQISSYLTN